MTDYQPNNKSLDPDEIRLFDPATLTKAQREVRNSVGWDEHVASVRDSFSNPPIDEVEFTEGFIDPKE